jgi:hypothetical protein
MDLTHNTASVTVQQLPTNKGIQYVNPNDVVFEVKYPEGYAGQRLMPEGPVIISKESAELFASRGLGKVVDPGEQPAGEETSAPVESIEESTTGEQPAGEEKKKKKGK